MSDDFDEHEGIGDDAEAYTLTEIDMGPEESEDKNTNPTVSADLRMHKLPEAPKMRGGAGQISANTGPKGVKADFEEAKKNQATINYREQLRKDMAVKTMAEGKTVLVPADNPADAKAGDNSTNKDKKKKKDEDSDSDFDDDDDDEVLAKRRQEKLKQLQFLQNSLPSFGDYVRVENLKFVHGIHELVWIVVHVYENDIQGCAKLHIAFENLAPQFEHVMFRRIRSEDAFKNYSKLGLPTLLLFRNGELVKSIIHAEDPNFPKVYTLQEVASFLARHNVLKVPDGGIKVPEAKSSTSSKSTATLLSDF